MNQMTSTVIADEANTAEDRRVTEVAASEAQAAADQLMPEQSTEPEATPDVVNDVEYKPPEVELSIEDRVEPAEAEQPAEVPAMEPETVVPVRRSARIAQGVTPPERYLLLTKIKEAIDKA
jgi:hypothetical protein